jgi:hypothetical protein
MKSAHIHERVRIVAATTFLLAATNAFAAKTDVVVLRNGDRFTGEVKQLANGQLKLSTDDAGTIYIEWDNIAAVTTAGRYEVATEDGALHVGRLGPGSADTVLVTAEDGAVTRLAFRDVVAFAAIKRGFFGRIDGTVDIGGSYTKSSDVAQVSIEVDARYRRPAYDVFTDFSSTLTSQREEPFTSRFTWTSGYTHFRPNRWIVTPVLFIERNVDLGLTFRGLGAITAGRYLQRSARSATLLSAGLAAGRERPIEGESIANLDGVIVFSTSFYRHDFPHSTVNLVVLVFPELNRWGRVRSNAHAKLKYELFKDFIATTTIYDSFDSEPQVSEVSRNDIGVTLSIGWTF